MLATACSILILGIARIKNLPSIASPADQESLLGYPEGGIFPSFDLNKVEHGQFCNGWGISQILLAFKNEDLKL